MATSGDGNGPTGGELDGDTGGLEGTGVQGARALESKMAILADQMAAQGSLLENLLRAQNYTPRGPERLGSRQPCLGDENNAGLSNGAPGVAVRALNDSYARHEKMRRMMKGAGFAREEVELPEFMDLLKATREIALRQAGVRVTWRDDGEEEDDADRGIGAQAELTVGIPDYPPRLFLPRRCTYTKPWQKWLLKQGDGQRSETDPRVTEGDTMSVVVLWMDYAMLCGRLAKAAKEQGDFEAGLDIREMQDAYMNVVYEALRRRVDEVTMGQISRPVAELLQRDSRMELEVVSMRPEAVYRMRDFNKATTAARTKAAAIKAATGQEWTGGGDSDATSKAAKKAVAAAAKKKKEDDDKKKNTPAGNPATAAQTAAERGRRTAAGGP